MKNRRREEPQGGPVWVVLEGVPCPECGGDKFVNGGNCEATGRVPLDLKPGVINHIGVAS